MNLTKNAPRGLATNHNEILLVPVAQALTVNHNETLLRA